jgi:hypothetical protein
MTPLIELRPRSNLGCIPRAQRRTTSAFTRVFARYGDALQTRRDTFNSSLPDLIRQSIVPRRCMDRRVKPGGDEGKKDPRSNRQSRTRPAKVGTQKKCLSGFPPTRE